MTGNDNSFDRDRISDAWADIRAYGSNLWQIVMLSIAASAVIMNLISRPDTGGSLIFFSLAGWLGLSILSGFTFFSTDALLWISKAINERKMMIVLVSGKIGKKAIPMTGKSNLTKEGDLFRITLRQENVILHWMPTTLVIRFSTLMWIVSVAFWIFQVPVTFNANLSLLLALLSLSVLISVLMGYKLCKEYRNVSQSSRALSLRMSKQE